MAPKSLVQGAAALAAAGIVVKIIGVFFRVPLTNWIGDDGMANYTPAYSLYSFLLVFATAGIPVAISKMVAEKYAIGQFKEAERVFRISRSLMLTIGGVGFCVLYFLSEYIAGHIIGIPGCALAMKATSPALLIVPWMSSYRGYFQGMQEMRPTAVSQVVEQVFRVGCGLALAVLLMNNSLGMEYTADERGAAGGCFGAVAGAIGGILTMLIIYAAVRKELKSRIANDKSEEYETTGYILKKIAVIAIPITIGAMIMPLVNLVDAAMVNQRLIASGWSVAEAKSMYGQLTGFAVPLIAFPQVFMTSIVVSLVPMVSATNKKGDYTERNNSIVLGMRMGTVLAFPCAAGMFVLAKPILLLLYPAQKSSAVSAVPSLQALCIGFLFLAMITVMTGPLQGIGKQVVPVINLFIGVVIKIGVTWVLTAIPTINIVGAAVGTIAAYVTAATLDFMALKKFTRIRVDIKNTVLKPLGSSVVMALIVTFIYREAFVLTGVNSLSLFVAIITGVVVYGVMILKTKSVHKEELQGTSFGRKLVFVCEKLKLW